MSKLVLKTFHWVSNLFSVVNFSYTILSIFAGFCSFAADLQTTLKFAINDY